MIGNLAPRPIGFMLLFAAGVAGCQQNPSSQPSASFSASGWTYHLRSLKPDAAADAGKAKEVWRDLFPGMAKDPKTRDLLKQLYADLPVQFVVLDAKQAEDKAALMAPPPEGSAIVMRVADISHSEEKSKAGTVPVRVIAFGHAVLIKDAAPPGSLDALAGDMKEEPSGGKALSLAMEDYVLRHAPGWVVISGPFFEDEKLPASPEVQRQDLDRRIKEYADHAKAFFGALRKR